MNRLFPSSRVFFRLVMFGWIVSLLLLSMTSNGTGAELSVSPMLIEMNQNPNSEKEFSFSVHATRRGKIKLTPYDMAQQETGHMDFFASPRGQRNPKTSILVLQQTNFTVTADKPVLVKGKVVLPRRARGTQLFAVMVEDDDAQPGPKGVRINVRYAVIIKVNVSGKSGRERGRFEALRIEKLNGQPVISGILANISPQDYRVASQLQIRDGSNRLLERVTLKSMASWKNGEERSRIFPGARVRLLGRFKKVTQPGTYKVRIVNRLGRRGQVVVSREIEILPEHLKEPSPSVVLSKVASAVRVTPNPIPVKWRKDRTAFSLLILVNLRDQPVVVRLPSAATQGNRTGSYVFVPRVVRLAAKGRGRVILKQKLGGSNPNERRTFTAEVLDEKGVSTSLKIRTISESKSKSNPFNPFAKKVMPVAQRG